MKDLRFAFYCIAICTTLFTNAKQPVTPNIIANADQQQMNNWVEATLSSMSLEERVGQLFVMTIAPELDEQHKAKLDRWIDTCHIGGLLFSGGYIEKQAISTNYAQGKTKIPLLITLDGEWGLGMRLKDSPTFPRALTLGAIQDESLIYKMGAEIARECRRMGIHVNFAPDADINDIPTLKRLRKRSFGESPYNVARKAIAYAKGMEDNGVVATAKHFPGHGSTYGNSHLVLPLITKSREELNKCEFVPFRQYIDAGLSGIMVGHLFVPAINPDTVPSSLSSKYVTDLLKGEFGFNGFIFTDALEMKGANTSGSACVKALVAGDNVLLNPRDPKYEIPAILQAIKDGIISTETIDENVRNMLRYKYALGITTKQHIDTNNIVNDVYSSEAESLINELWSNAITAYPSKHKTLPIATSKRVAVINIGGKDENDNLFQETCATLSTIDKYTYNNGDDISALVDAINAKKYDAIVLAIYGDDKLRVVCDNITSRCKHVIPVFFVDYYDIHRFNYTLKNCDEFVVAYSNEKPAQVQAARTIFGQNEARGKLPISIPGFYKLDISK